MMHRNDDLDALPTLTRQDLNVLKAAESVSFKRSPDDSYIVANTIANQRTREEIRTEVPAHSSLHGGHDLKPGQKPLPDVAYCFVHIFHANNTHTEWHTIVRLLKVGDRLELVWRRDANRNQYMERANLHGDRLQLAVHRKTSRGYQHLLFHVESQCCEDNTARMIRRGRHNTE